MTARPGHVENLAGSRPTRDAETLAGIVDPTMEVRARRILQRLSATDRKLGTAESCTGGLLASLFTDVEGVSHVFDRGFVTYDEDAKCELLGVPREMIDEHGVVSRQVAVAMAEGMLACCPADVTVAVTGYAGRGAEPGLVHLALARTDQPTAARALRFGTVGRGVVRIGVLDATLKLMEELL